MLIFTTPRPNVRTLPLDALPRLRPVAEFHFSNGSSVSYLRPVEAFEQPMVEEPQPVPVCTWWELLGLLIVTAFGAAGVYATICMVLL